MPPDIASSAASFDTIAPAPAPAPSPTPAPAPAPAPTPAPAPEAAAPAAPSAPTPFEKATSDIRGILDSGKKKPAVKAEPTTPEADDAELEKQVKSNPKAWKVLEGIKAKFKADREAFVGEKATLESRLKALEAKPAPTAADEAKIKAYEDRIAALDGERKSYQQQLAETDYKKGEEFKAKYLDKWQSTYKAAAKEIATLPLVDEMGEATDKLATQQHLELIRNLPAALRRGKAKEMFGENAPDVIGYIRELERIEGEGEAAAANHAQNYEKTAAEKKQKEIEEGKRYGDLRTSAQKEIETQYPEYFSPEHFKDQPELQKILADGYQWIDTISSNPNLPPDERATQVAMVRARAAAASMLIKQGMMKDAKIAAMEEELKKYQGSDPGSVSGRVPAATPAETTGGIEKMAMQFD